MSICVCTASICLHLEGLTLSEGMQLIHYIDILIQEKSERGMQDTLEKLVEHMRNKGWEINPNKIQELAQTIKCLGVKWHCGNQERPPNA